jgi:hypothetical protein
VIFGVVICGIVSEYVYTVPLYFAANTLQVNAKSIGKGKILCIRRGSSECIN